MSLFNRVRERLSGYQADVDPHEWRLPSSYSASKSSDRATAIPNPRIFLNAFVPSDPTLGTTEASLIYPDISHAAVHLALLECFRKLRLSASGLDVELEKLPAYSATPKPNSHEGPTRLPESQRWDLLIRLAITRFTAWWMKIDQVFHHATAYTHHGGHKSVVQLTKDYLPPLDVLLVWYAFMLDEDQYAAASRDRAMPNLLQLCFPWPAIRDLVDIETMSFTLPRAAENLFSTLSYQSADILTYLSKPPAYTEVPGLPFEIEIDLFAEVKKHEKFIDEAHELLWIRSPAIKSSLQRSSVDYLEFQLSGRVNETAVDSVPFGIELIRRTHQLYPIQYRLFRQGTGAESQSDSKTPASSPLRTVSLKSSNRREHPFSQCYCWTCERIRDEIPDFTYDTSRTPSFDVSLMSSLSSDQLRSIQDDLGFYHAFEDARRRNLPLPTRPPTAAEKATERLEAKKKAEAGVLPGLNEYIEVLPNGKRKLRRVKAARMTYGSSMAT